MITRNDLVRQFELVVKQEIKNSSDSVYASTLAINEMKLQVKELTEKLAKSVAEFEEAKTWKRIYIDELRTLVDKEQSSSASKFGDVQSNFIAMTNELNALKKTTALQNENHNKLIEQLKDARECISILRQGINDFAASFRNEMQTMFSKVSEKVAQTKEEILSIPSEAKQVRADLENQLSIAKVDRDGVMKEMAVCKKASYITEKKIENIYTLIERLDKRISS